MESHHFEDSTHRPAKSRAPKPRLILSVTLPIFALASFGAWVFFPSTESTEAPRCGTSAMDAISQHCWFDVMSFSWLPEPCFDNVLTAEFLNVTSWRWYGDPQGNHEIPYETIETGEIDEAFVSAQYHVTHCVMMWKKMHRAISNGWPIDSYIGSLNHTEHCSRMLLTQGSPDAGTNLNTIIRAKYPSCQYERGSV
jgi:hypothetical protein